MRLAIDPGLRWCGVALGTFEGLFRAELVINPEKTKRGPLAWAIMGEAVWDWCSLQVSCPNELELYVEVPRIYPQMDQRKGDLNDLIEVAGALGAVCGNWGSVARAYYPAEWKGQVPKKVMTERIRKKLRPEELDNMVSVGARDHNTLDAVGIFLHSVGRL